MGIKNILSKVGDKAGNAVAKLATLSPDQLQKVQKDRENYLSEMPDMTDSAAEELTKRLLAASGVEIFHAYLSQLDELYVPVKKDTEYERPFQPEYNIRYFNITKWVTDKKENNLEKLVNVYEVLSNEECNIALIFNRRCDLTEVYLAVTNTLNSDNSVDINNYRDRLLSAIRGNFPGSELSECKSGILPCFSNRKSYSVATASNIPTEKSEKFISQTIEKLLDGCIPDTSDKEYTIILLATPIQDVEERKLKLSDIYSGLAPYSSWQTNFTYTESNSTGSSATVGVNIGASAGVQNGQTQATTTSDGVTESTGTTDTESVGTTDTQSTNETITDSTGSSSAESEGYTTSRNETETEGITHTNSTNKGSTDTAGGGAAFIVNGNYSHTWNSGESISNSDSLSNAISEGKTASVTKNITETTGKAVANMAGKAVASSVGKSIASTLGKALTNSIANTAGIFSSASLGANFGANFAKSSNVTATIGKNEGITQSYTNYTIKHALELLEEQMKRYEQSTALGMWDFAAYILSEDQNVANNVAHSYVALTQGKESYMSRAAINLWRGDMAENSEDANEIFGYLKELRHPVFGLNPRITEIDPKFNVYPPIVTATTSLSGKELAYSLNFPQKSVAGLPVIECTEFGRNVVTYDMNKPEEEKFNLGKIFNMNHEERANVEISKKSLASHVFITGSTGSGKSNTVYKIIDEARNDDIKFLVIEPAKGEYKTVFGMDDGVFVYGTNPELTPMLKINPFSFPKGIHVLEHLDRLVEIFNVCWPMYAAMPAVLKNAVEKSYEKCGWNLNTSKNKYGETIFPTFADVAYNVKSIIDSSEYDNENKGAYKGSLLTRLQSLTNGINGMIFVQDELSSENLFDENVIIDLSRIGSTETKSMIMGMLVLKLQEYRMTISTSINSDLKHITVLEEAHNLLKKTSTMQSSESSNLLGKSVEMLANSIAEMRTYGEGFIIVDQSPGLLDMSTIRNTNTKIIMRLPDFSDRELVGKSANLNDDQIIELAKLPCGVAAVYQNEWIQPVLCKVNKYNCNSEVGYVYTLDNNDDVYGEYTDLYVKDSLLDCIMNKEIFRTDNQEDIIKLKDMILKSNLDTKVKCDFLEYITAENDKSIEKLRTLVYDFLEAAKAIEMSKSEDNIYDWINAVVDRLSFSLKNYSKQQLDLVMALIIYEQSIRDTTYNDILCRFAEIYKNEGGVF